MRVTRIGSTCGFCSLRLCGELLCLCFELVGLFLCFHGELDLVVRVDLCHHLSDSVGAHALLDIFEVFLRRDTADECLGVLDLYADLRDNDVDDKQRDERSEEHICAEADRTAENIREELREIL